MIGQLTTEQVYHQIYTQFRKLANEVGLDLDDVAQEIMVKLLTSVAFDPAKSTEQTFIHTVGLSVFIDLLRKKIKDDRDYKHIAAAYRAREATPPQESLLPTIKQIQVDLDIEDDSIEYAALVLMLQGYSRADVAEQLGIPYYSRPLRGLLTELENYLNVGH